jgi:hypothetical protein
MGDGVAEGRGDYVVAIIWERCPVIWVHPQRIGIVAFAFREKSWWGQFHPQRCTGEGSKNMVAISLIFENFVDHSTVMFISERVGCGWIESGRW